MKIRLLLLLFLSVIIRFAHGQTTIIPQGSTWKYYDKGNLSNTSWRSVSFNDATWKSGPAQLGYGDGDEATVVSFGTNPSKKYITTYFRKVVAINTPSNFKNFTLTLKRDDGAVVYVNGVERFRTNMPTGSISGNTKASTAASDDGNNWQTITLATSVFVNGNNAIGIEIHQFSASDPDISFDLQLVGNFNIPPVSNSGADQTITLPLNTTLLSGSASSDPDGTISSYAWSQMTGPSSSAIATPASVNTSISNLIQGTYRYRLVVTDNNGATSADTVAVTVNPAPNQPPIANAGSDQSITLPQNSVTLNGSASSDPDGSISAYSWIQVAGPSVSSIVNATGATTLVSNLIQGTYQFRLVVTDNNGTTATDTVSVTINAAVNTPPVALAGPDQNIQLPMDSAMLDGSSSSDADGSISAYMWTQISGPAVSTIVNSTSASTLVKNLIQGVYQYRLMVTDNNGATAADTVLITVTAMINVTPVANAGADQSINLPVSTITLNGGGSSDADGSIISYSWNQLSGPSTASFANAYAVNTSVSGLIQGTYTFRLTVTDNNGATATDDIVVTVNPLSDLTAISFGSVWSYNDAVVSAVSNWNTSTYNDATWKTGPAQLGYGDGDEATVVSFGPSSTNKYITTFFRKNVNIVSPSSYANFTLSVKRDDGIVVYVNGTEVFRNNMPTGTIAYNTFASTAASDDGGSIISGTLSTSSFVNGNNLIAVEIHQNAVSSSDISFDLELKANPPGVVNLTRGPYLQMGNQTAVTIRWRTDSPTDSKFEAGTVLGTYTLSAYDATQTTEHEVRLTGLTPDTRYYYRFGSSNHYLQTGNDNFFKTAPASNHSGKVRVAVFGDCGRNDNSYQTATLNSYRNYVSSDPASIMLLLGDNAYNSGTEAEYTSNFFNVYSGNILKNHVLFPAPGNHDYANSSARQADHNVPYYNIFTMPTAGECGGVASGTEAFYSYDWGNIHFLSLDSYGQETGSTRLYDTLGPQVTWIKNDLNANTKKWTIAYWHHPPYTMGSHNSDTESELVNMRQNFIRILERYGVDLILCGHSHDYERSYLLKGYYGNEASFNAATHAVSNSSAKYDGSANSCPYHTVSGPVNHGTVYVVSGSAGASGGVQAGYPHNALPFAQNDGGMLFLEFEDNRLDGKFIRKDAVIADQFTIMKDVSPSTVIPITAGQSVTLTASWVGSYSWSNGATTRSISVSPDVTTTYTCSDGSTACLSEQFTVNVSSQRLSLQEKEFAVYPVPVSRGSTLIIQTGTIVPTEVTLMDATGKVINRMMATGIWKLDTTELSTGIYFVHSVINGKLETRKVVVQ